MSSELQSYGVENVCPVCKSVDTVIVYGTERMDEEKIYLFCFCDTCGMGLSTTVTEAKERRG